MRIVLQRVLQASVDVDGKSIGQISNGLLLFVAIAKHDTEADADELVEKICKLRIFSAGGKSFMEQNIVQHQGSILIISQFTLYGTTKKGTRPDFALAASPVEANQLYEYLIRKFLENGIPTESGRFGQHMEVSLINDGPVTLIIDSTRNNII